MSLLDDPFVVWSLESGIACAALGKVQAAMAEVLGHEVYTHELAKTETWENVLIGLAARDLGVPYQSTRREGPVTTLREGWAGVSGEDSTLPDERTLPPAWDDPNCPSCGKLGNLVRRLVNEPGGDFASYCCETSSCRVLRYEGGYSPEAREEPRMFLTAKGQAQVNRRRLDRELLEVIGRV